MKWKRKKIIRLILTLDILDNSLNMKSEFVQDKVLINDTCTTDQTMRIKGKNINERQRLTMT